MRTRISKFVRTGAGASLLVGGMGLAGALGIGLATSTTAGAATAPFNLTCGSLVTGNPNQIPVVKEMSVTGVVVTGTLTPTPTVNSGSHATLSGMTLPMTVPKTLAAAGAGDHLTVKIVANLTASNATPGTASVTFQKTVIIPPAHTIPTTGLVVTLPGTPSTTSYLAHAVHGTLVIGLDASTVTVGTTKLFMKLGSSTLGAAGFGCSNVAGTVASDAITVAPLSITTTSPLPGGKATHSYSTTLVAAGGTGVYTGRPLACRRGRT